MSMIDRTGDAFDRVLARARRNPEGALLLAAGVALLMRRGIGAATDAMRNDEPRGQQDRHRGFDEGNGRRSDLIATAKAYASDVVERVGQSAENVADYTSHAARGAIDRTGRLASGTTTTLRSTLDRVLDEQPLTVALFGLAAGAVVAGAMPPTDIERDALRPLGRRLNETVDEATSRLKQTAKNAAQRLGEVAHEHGLNADGLREAASAVAQTVEEGMMGQGSGQNPRPASGGLNETVENTFPLNDSNRVS